MNYKKILLILSLLFCSIFFILKMNKKDNTHYIYTQSTELVDIKYQKNFRHPSPDNSAPIFTGITVDYSYHVEGKLYTKKLFYTSKYIDKDLMCHLNFNDKDCFNILYDPIFHNKSILKIKEDCFCPLYFSCISRL